MDFGRLWKENPWVPPILGIVGVGATFVLGGLVPGVIGLIFFLLVAIGVLGNSLRIARSTENGSLSIPMPESRVEEEDSGTESHPREPATEPQESSTDAPAVEPEEFSLLAAIKAAQDKKPAEVSDLMDPWIDQAENEADRVHRMSIKQSFLAQAGVASSIDALRKLMIEHPTRYSPLNCLSIALEQFGEISGAAEVLAERRERVSDKRSFLALREAQLRRLLGQPEEALSVSEEALTLAESENETADVLEEKGRALRDLGRELEGLAQFEESITLQPSDMSLRFDLAYAYAQIDFGELAISHYDAIVKSNRASASARNNYGVALHALGMPFLGTASYREGLDRGSGLAGANLAYLAIEAGLKNEAEEWLEQARRASFPHENVGSATARLVGAEDEDSSKLEEVLREANQLRLQVRGATNASPDAPSGRWTLDTGEIVSFTSTSGNAVEGETEAKDLSILMTRNSDDETVFQATLRKGRYVPQIFRGFAFLRAGVLVALLSEWSGSGRMGVVTARVTNDE